jgi:hypothetical protein
MLVIAHACIATDHPPPTPAATHAPALVAPEKSVVPLRVEASCQAAWAVKALAQHACGRSALVAAGAEAALAAAARPRQGGCAAALAEALEALRRPPEPGPGSLAAGPAPRLCTACGAPGSRARPLKLCVGCRGLVRWCSTECQRSSWAGHRRVCLERRAAAAAPAAAASGSR